MIDISNTQFPKMKTVNFSEWKTAIGIGGGGAVRH